MTFKLVTLAAAAVLGTTACASTGQAPMNNAAPTNAPIQVTVRNDKNRDVDIYAMVGGKYDRIATVPALETREVDLPAQANTTNGVALEVKPVGSSHTYVAKQILVEPGQGIDLRVSNKLQQSSWAVD